MITRKISKLIRGKATPFQVFAACVLASLIAFVPGFGQAPGLLIVLISLVVILNANLFLVGIVGVVAKLLALLLTPVSFAIGRFLLEGPTRGLFEAIVNAPVLAYFGFDYYVVAGGQFLGLVVGLLLGFVAARSLNGVRRRLANFEKDSAAFQKWSEKRWAKVTAFVFIGGIRGKKSYETLLAKRVGNPIRPLGAALVGLMLVLGFVAALFFDDAIVASYARAGLERANGATVDLGGASVDLSEGRLTLTGLAMADRDNLDTNLFAADSIEAAISTTDLLRKRAAIDSVIVVGARQGEKRSVRGQLIGPSPDIAEEEEAPADGGKPLEEYLADAKMWKERLSTAQRWLDRLSEYRPEKADAAATGKSFEERLRERVEALGYANVKDDSLVNQAPTLLIRHLEAGEVKAASLPDETLNIVASNLSTQPHLNTEPPQIRVESSSSDKLSATLTLPGADLDQGRLAFALRRIPVDEVADQLKSDGTPLLRGGTMDVQIDGTISVIDSNLPMNVTLHDTNVAIGGSSPRHFDTLQVPVAIRGPIDSPSIHFDPSSLGKAVVDAGKEELKRKVESEIGEKLGVTGEPEEGNGDAKEAASGLLKDLLNKKKEQPEQPSAE